MNRRRLRALVAGGLGGAGILVGHSLGYLAVAPEAGRRRWLLETSGHSYLPFAWPILLGVAGFSALLAIWIGFTAGRSPRRRNPARWPAVVVPCVLQAIGFVVLEVGERLIGHGGHALLGPVLAVGLPLQLLVGAVAGFLLISLVRAGERLARLGARPTRPRRRAPSPAIRRSVCPPRVPVSDSLRQRAPPLLA
jgi:hypothetical protein